MGGIQTKKLSKLRSNAGDKVTGVDAEKALDAVFGNNYRIRLDHSVLDDHGVFYPQALYNDLVFQLTLASASQFLKGSDASKLVYKLINIQLEYGTIRSNTLGKEATSVYNSSKEFAYDHIMREEVMTFAKSTDSWLNIRLNPQRRALNGILLLFIEPYARRRPSLGKIH